MKNIILTIYFTICMTHNIFCDGFIVDTEYGKLSGTLQFSSVGKPYYAFLNIPYAKPPINELRFKAPEDPKPWSGIRDATKYGPSCPNYNMVSKTFNKGSEDCLTHNVYSPNLLGKLPVIVYIHGAAFAFDADLDMYGPDYLVAKDTVVVTFNYRYGPLGFLSLGTKDVPGNAGLKDHAKVLKWVKKNIKNFGGDPDNVTIFGHSSGSASIAYHLTSPMTKDYFHKAILVSGSYTCDAITPYKVERKSYLFANLLGVKAKTPSELLLKLQDIPYEKLFINTKIPVLASEEITNVIFKKMAPFVPVVEKDFGQERFITENSTKQISNPKYAKSILVGYTDKESLMVVDQYAETLIPLYNRYPELLVPTKILYKSSPEIVLQLADKIRDYYFENKDISIDSIKEFIECTSWANMIEDVLVFVEKVSKIFKTYLFKFSSYSSRNYYGNRGETFNVTGAAHTDSVFYAFNPKPLHWTLRQGSEEYNMIDQFVSTITHFAKTGRPTDDSNAWPPYNTDTQYYVEFTNTTTLKQGPGGDNKLFWDEVYRSANVEF